MSEHRLSQAKNSTLKEEISKISPEVSLDSKTLQHILSIV